ncbi:MAG TPA: hypothetical protein VFK45_01575 [Gammaproteobacteria bacterium]|nr:hypothetical protein [Gammaproteobacteria bacterium]
MADNVNNLVLEQLRLLRGGQDGIRRELRDIKARLSTIEHHVAGEFAHGANVNDRLDDYGDRLERIERRLELREPE